MNIEYLNKKKINIKDVKNSDKFSVLRDPSPPPNEDVLNDISSVILNEHNYFMVHKINH